MASCKVKGKIPNDRQGAIGFESSILPGIQCNYLPIAANFVVCCLRDQVKVDVEVTVEDAVARSDDPAPWDLGISAMCVGGDVQGGFGDDFEDLGHGVVVQVAVPGLRVGEVCGAGGILFITMWSVAAIPLGGERAEQPRGPKRDHVPALKDCPTPRL